MEILVDNKGLDLTNLSNVLIESNNNSITFMPKQVVKDPIKLIFKENLKSPFSINVGDLTELNLILEYELNNDAEIKEEINLTIGKQANVKYLFVSENAKGKINIVKNISIGRDSNLLQIGTFNNKDINSDWYVGLDGIGAKINVQNLLISSDSDSQIISYHLTHNAKQTDADLNLIGAATEQGFVQLNGIAKIENGMNKSNAFQTLKGIILNEDARIDVNPILIIDEYDIKAGHAATVGKIEEEQLYYLMSRGLNKVAATKLIVKGFLTPVIDLINDEDIKNHLLEIVEEKLW